MVSAVTAVIPVVSESFSFEGRATRSTSSGDTVYSVYNVAVDRDRSLLLIETETGGESGFRLESDTANLLIQSWGGCVGGAYTQNTDNPFSISTDPWEFLSNPNTLTLTTHSLSPQIHGSSCLILTPSMWMKLSL